MAQSPIRAFATHGVDLRNDINGQIETDCPFPDCGKASHFYINSDRENTKYTCWDCKSCNRSGNVYSFLSQYHAYWLEWTTDRHYEVLTKHRGNFPIGIWRDALLAYDDIFSRWLLPIYNCRPGLVNLKRWVKGEKLKSTAGCNNHMYRLHYLQDQGPVYICEGEWDSIILNWVCDQIDLAGSSLGLPGAPKMPLEAAQALRGREIYLLMDNDRQGLEASEKHSKTLYNCGAKRILSLDWASLGVPDKYDIKDHFTIHRGNPEYGWDLLTELLREVPGEGTGPKQITEEDLYASYFAACTW